MEPNTNNQWLSLENSTATYIALGNNSVRFKTHSCFLTNNNIQTFHHTPPTPTSTRKSITVADFNIFQYQSQSERKKLRRKHYQQQQQIRQQQQQHPPPPPPSQFPADPIHGDLYQQSMLATAAAAVHQPQRQDHQPQQDHQQHLPNPGITSQEARRLNYMPKVQRAKIASASHISAGADYQQRVDIILFLKTEDIVNHLITN